MYGNLNGLLGLGVSIFLRDDFTKNSKKVYDSFTKLNKGMQGRIKNQLNQIQTLGVGVGLAGVGIMRGMRSAVNEVALFQESLYKTKGIAGITGDEMERLKYLALDMSYKFPYAAGQISDAFLELSKAGVAANDMEKMTKAVLSFASAADIQIGGEEGATNMLLNIMAGFKMPYKSAMLVSDMIAKAANVTTVSPSQIYESFKYSQDTLKNFNLSLSDSLALISAMAQSGIKGSRAGIALQNMYVQLAKSLGEATPKDKKALAMLGLDTKSLMDSHGNLLDIATILGIIQPKLAAMGDIEASNVMNNLFGVRGGRGASDLANFLEAKGLEGMPAKSLAELRRLVSPGSAIGSSADIVKARMDSPEQRLQQWNKAMMDFKVSFVDAILPILLPAVQFLAKVMQKMAQIGRTPLGKAVMVIGALAVVITTIAAFTAAAVASLAILRLSGRLFQFKGQGGIISIFQMLFGNLKGKFTLFNSIGRLITPLGRFMPLWATGLKGVFPWLTKVVGLLGPWGKALAGIAGTGYILYNMSSGIKTMFDDLGKSIGEFFKTIWAYIKYAGNLIRTLDEWGYSKNQADVQLDEDLRVARGLRVSQPNSAPSLPNFSVSNPYGMLDKYIKILTNSPNREVTLTVVMPDGKKISRILDEKTAMNIAHNGFK